ncbi:MAG: hypothetical protein ACRC5T_04345 [Cetobacterium sp.]
MTKDERRKESMVTYVLNEMAGGKKLTDIVMYYLPNPVEWDTEGQVWTVTCELVLADGQWVLLLSGRGGAEEEAHVYEARYIPEKQEYKYTVKFGGKTEGGGKE